MKDWFIFKIFKSNYCKFVLIIMLIISYFILPKKIFYGYYNVLAYAFIFLFALSSTCLIRSIKDKIILKRKNKQTFIGFLAGLIGLSALQVCTVGAPICGASIGGALVATLFPKIAFNYLSKYALYFILLSIVLQLFSLLQMKCFQKVYNLKNCN